MCVCVCVCLGMTKVEEKLKAGRGKRPEGSGFSEEPQRRPNHSQPTKKDPAPAASGKTYPAFLYEQNIYSYNMYD